jgi:hypothetical protein
MLSHNRPFASRSLSKFIVTNTNEELLKLKGFLELHFDLKVQNIKIDARILSLSLIKWHFMFPIGLS